ncbi:MAG: hypothetical protein JW839_11540, partial [Candidatus Lokiarchaeota archaeon]|nr:hypothetical protein [Candidatus Lokiarchaeota archaeon]
PRRSPPGQTAATNATTTTTQPQHQSQPARATRTPRQKAGKVFVSAVLVLALVGAVFAVVTVLTWGSYKGNASYSYNPAVPSTSDAWTFGVDNADLNIVYTTSPSAPEVNIDVQYDFAGGFLAGKTPDDLYSVTWDNSSGSKVFSLATKNWWSFPMFQNNLVTVTLKSGINFTITASTSTGSGEIAVPSNENLTSLSLSASTGDVKASLGENVSIEGDVCVEASTGSATYIMEEGSSVGGMVEVSASTGSVSVTAAAGELWGGISVSSSTGSAGLTLERTTIGGNITVETSTGSAGLSLVNVTLANDIALDASVSTGTVTVNVDQAANPGGNITASFSTSTGSVHVTYKGDDAHASAKFTTSTGTGTAHFTNTGGFTTPSATEFQSVNQSNPCRFDAQVSTGTGNAYITGSML